MHQILLIVLLHNSLLHTNQAANTTTDLEIRNKEIIELEKQKSDLFKQINEAIEDSVKSLKQSNNSEAVLGISYIEDLKKQFKLLNDTETGPARFTPLDKTPNFRRDNPLRAHTKKGVYLDDKYFDVNKIFGNKQKDPKKWRQRYKNRIIIQKKLDEWIAQRESEKNKIRKYKDSQRKNKKLEKCPRYGSILRKKKKRGKKSGDNIYPCCRKCCKMSYMGCLKK